MTCDDFKHDLHAYHMGELDLARIDRLLSHQSECANCARLMEIADEMTCRDFTELLNEYVEDTLSDERRERFARHLSICPDCTAYLQSYRATMRMSAVAMRKALRRLSEEMPDELVGAILAARAEEERANGD